jgi:hypothetical protein
MMQPLGGSARAQLLLHKRPTFEQGPKVVDQPFGHEAGHDIVVDHQRAGALRGQWRSNRRARAAASRSSQPKTALVGAIGKEYS